jgi:pilus assembly protein CpaC
MYTSYRFPKNRIINLFTLLLLVFVAPDFAASQDDINIDLNLGEQQVIPSEGVRSYSEGTPGIVDVRLTKDASQFVLVGMRPGTTTLLFIMLDGSQRHYRITVKDPNAKLLRDKPLPANEPPNRVTAEDNIRLDFYFVQLSKAYQHQIGIGWPGAIGGGHLNTSFNLMSGSFTEATAVVTDQVLPRLDVAQSAGWAKLMRQAAVITANGKDADYSGGGEVNIAIQGALTAEIRQIKYGSTIKVLPRYDRETGRIELTIRAEVSDLTDSSGSAIPGRVTSNLDTVVNLELGQSLALAGLTARSQSHTQTGLPGLSQIPILGVFFGSNAVRDQEVENVVFIVPTVVDAVSLQARARIREAMLIYEKYSGDLDEVQFIEPGKPKQKPRRSQ